MFFTQELLARRDSGFGLLWLAATLGSKSTFKKLPKRSVLTADITQLCDLISEPMEPMALRLSSNLMFGVVRVFKVKQEILMTDVTNCVASLKKIVLEMNSHAIDAQLQMAQTSIRPSAVTIVPDPRAAHILDFDAFVTDWDEFLNIIPGAGKERKVAADNNDEDFDSSVQDKKQKAKNTAVPPTEILRKQVHTLDEHHEHLLSASFDLSFVGSGPQGDVSSSQAEAAFDLNENIFDLPDGLGIGEGLGLGDELARELGWGSPEKSGQLNMVNFDMDFNMGGDYGPENNFTFDAGRFTGDREIGFDAPIAPTPTPAHKTPAKRATANKGKGKQFYISKLIYQFTITHAENLLPPLRESSAFPPRDASSATSFSRLLLSQDFEQPAPPFNDITVAEQSRINREEPAKSKKRTRLLLDARTELTDEELKIARAQYLDFQNNLRRVIVHKKFEKNSGRLIDELIWGVPNGIEAPSLVDFWQENFKVQVEARSGILRIHCDEPARKRRKTDVEPTGDEDQPHDDQIYPGMDAVMEAGDVAFYDVGDPFGDQINHRRSSEEPGQARRASRPSSVLNFGLDIAPQEPVSGSQKSSLFPWDNAGGSSSSGKAPFGLPESNNVPIDYVEIRMRGSSKSRRENSLVPSQTGSVAGGLGYSPIPLAMQSQISGTDYQFDVDVVVPEEETQKSEINNLVTLEKNSFNFLEYAKMQYHTIPQPRGRLSFDSVVPQATSTRHVASTAFYHCLVLATKDLVRIEQQTPYSPVMIVIR